ncbi:MAG TPA: hypothetical protein VFP84_05050, partial [Kofleriaceae bacterium]|nr:hypothetical protein [Kofleriaceae bacterium]
DAIPVAPPVPGLEAAGSDDGDGAGSAPPAFGLSDDKLQAVMADANKAYDRGDYEEARTIAGRVLIRQPSNARMLRILVSSSCIEGDAVAAQASMAMLPPADQERMRIRCQRYGITLTVPSAAAAK